jgi:hypothetical protein
VRGVFSLLPAHTFGGQQRAAPGACVPITPYLRGQAFDPATIEAMEKAFVTTCEALGLGDRTSHMNEIVARKIIELAQRGLRDPTALYFAAMRELIPTDKRRN